MDRQHDSYEYGTNDNVEVLLRRTQVTLGLFYFINMHTYIHRYIHSRCYYIILHFLFAVLQCMLVCSCDLKYYSSVSVQAAFQSIFDESKINPEQVCCD